MSFKLVAQVMDIKVGSPLRKIILIKLADQANDDGVCWPSYETIAKACEITKRSVITHIQKLEDQGFLRIEKRYNKSAGKNYSNRYHLTLYKGSENRSLVQMAAGGSEGDSLGSENGALGSEGDSPEPINEPINESINKEYTDCSLLNSNQKLNDADAQNPDASLSNTFNSNIGNKADDFTFDEFWEMYDRKIERKKCEAKFARLTIEVKELIKATLPKYLEITKDGRPQRKHPSTYLNNECWNDDLSALAFNDKPASGSVINTYHPSHTPAAPTATNTTVEQDQRNKEIGMQKAAQLKAMMSNLQKGQSL